MRVGLSSAERRFPSSVYGRGDEPDPRFSLANERTFLAWIRTALALLAGAVALMALKLPVPWPLQVAAAALLAVAAVSGSVLAWISWMHTELALRLSAPLPGAGARVGVLILLVVAVVVLATGAVLGVSDGQRP
jgi:putative membrane protein